MCPCTVIKIIVAAWVAGWFLLPLIDSYYRGKTGETMFPEDDESRPGTIFIWPMYFIFKAIVSSVTCAYKSYVNLCEWIEKQGRK